MQRSSCSNQHRQLEYEIVLLFVSTVSEEEIAHKRHPLLFWIAADGFGAQLLHVRLRSGFHMVLSIKRLQANMPRGPVEEEPFGKSALTTHKPIFTFGIKHDGAPAGIAANSCMPVTVYVLEHAFVCENPSLHTCSRACICFERQP
eukprot:6198071-Pleurochrysis_carterae.AAC.2